MGGLLWRLPRSGEGGSEKEATGTGSAGSCLITLYRGWWWTDGGGACWSCSGLFPVRVASTGPCPPRLPPFLPSSLRLPFLPPASLAEPCRTLAFVAGRPLL